MRIAIKTLGCKVNQSESESLSSALDEHGHNIVRHDESPDICIINTCTVTAKSDYQSRQMIRRAIRSGARVIATGCYAQLRPEELSEIKGIDYILGNAQKNSIHEYINKISKSDSNPAPVKTAMRGRSRAFMKIQDGCDFSCSYCTVPMARGKSKSIPPEEIIRKAGELIKHGFREIVLTGIHIGCYGLDLKPESSLSGIVERLTDHYPVKGRARKAPWATGLYGGPNGEKPRGGLAALRGTLRPGTRFRLSSIEPQELNKGLMGLIKKRKICPHLHIPLQSGSDRILKAMNRRYTVSFFEELIGNITATCPDIAIGTDVIVGFPGETDKDFEQTAVLLEKLPLSYIHVFPYSKRPDTKAADMEGHLHGTIIKNRAALLHQIAQNKKNTYAAGQLGRTLDVIVEKRESTRGIYKAISQNYIKVLIKAEKLQPGEIVHVVASYFDNGDLVCSPLK